MEVIEAGARMLMLNPAFDYQEQMEILAQAEVVPGIWQRRKQLLR